MSSEPKYQTLKNFIIEYIRNGELKYNDRIFSETELMEKFSISRHTARKAIDDLVNEGWLYKQQGKGTFVSDPQAGESGNGKMVGVVMTYFNDYIFPEIISGINEELSGHGYGILLGSTNNRSDRERTVLNNMLGNQLAGLIIEPTRSVYPNHNIDLLEQFKDRGVPILYIHGSYTNFPASYVVEDDVEAGLLATDHLIELGHRRIGAIFKSDDVQGHGRYQGYVKAQRQKGLFVDEASVLWYSTDDRQKVVSEENWQQLAELIDKTTAIVCYNDQVAVELIQLMKEHEVKVPEDCSIVSFDNSNLSHRLDLKLTTVAHPKAELGIHAAKGLLELIRDRNTTVEEMMMPELIIRDTTGKPKRNQ